MAGREFQLPPIERYSTTRQLRIPPDEINLDSARLVFDQGYSITAANRSLGVRESVVNAGPSAYNLSLNLRIVSGHPYKLHRDYNQFIDVPFRVC